MLISPSAVLYSAGRQAEESRMSSRLTSIAGRRRAVAFTAREPYCRWQWRMPP